MTIRAVRAGKIVETSERWSIGYDMENAPDDLDFAQGRFVLHLLLASDVDGRVRLAAPRPPGPAHTTSMEDRWKARVTCDTYWDTLWWAIAASLIRPLDRTFEFFQVNPDEILVVPEILLPAARDRFGRSTLHSGH